MSLSERNGRMLPCVGMSAVARCYGENQGTQSPENVCANGRARAHSGPER